MSRLSPAVGRTVAVLDFFADHPGQAFTLTDLIRALRISRATCHSLIAALVEAGYLYRNLDKSYVLGPALARLAAAVRLDERPLQAAIPEMRLLADSLDVICSAVFCEGGEAVVRERASSFSHIGWAAQLGHRFPLQPPFGNVFMAWNTSDQIERWLKRSETGNDEESGDRARANLAFLRRCGFSFGLRTEHLRGDTHAQSLVYRLDKTDYVPTELIESRSYDLAFVASPVFDVEGRVAFVLALMGFTSTVPGGEVARIGATLRDACGRVTGFIGGTRPASASPTVD